MQLQEERKAVSLLFIALTLVPDPLLLLKHVSHPHFSNVWPHTDTITPVHCVLSCS